MKDTKIDFRYYSVADWQKEQDYLRQQHQHGWRFVKVSFIGFYYFEKCEPEDMIYQLDYNPDGLAHKDEYVQMFRDCGWEYLLDFVGYSYFRKPASGMNGDEEIFCDDASRMDMMKRILTGRILPLFVIFMAIILPGIFRYVHTDTLVNHIWLGVFLVLFAVYVILFLTFGFQYWKFRKNLHE